MAEMDDVASGEVIESAWGNQIRDRTFQRYTNTTERDTLNAAPTEGDLAYVESIDEAQFYDGAAWVTLVDENATAVFLKLSGGTMTGALSMGGFRIESLADPNSGDDAMDRDYADARYLELSGGTMTGVVNMGGQRIENLGTPNSGDDAIDRDYADARYLELSGGTMTGKINLPAGTLGNPSLDFGTAGIYRGASGYLYFESSGTVRATLGSEFNLTGDFFQGSPTTTTNNTLPSWRHLNVGSPYQHVPLVSSKRFKRGITAADPGQLVEVLRRVELKQWQEKGSPKDSVWITGIVADDAAEIEALRPLVAFDDQGPLAFDFTTALAANQLAAIQQLLTVADSHALRLAALEKATP